MKEFTSTVTLTFDINNIEANSQRQHIKALKEQYLDLYNVYLKDHEGTFTFRRHRNEF